jgi:hypothetical protein
MRPSSGVISLVRKLLNTIKYANVRERNLCVGNKIFEMVQKFKYLSAVTDDENNVTYTILERIQSGNKANNINLFTYLLTYSWS